MERDLLLSCAGGTVTLPARPLNHRRDGGHLLVNPPREVWERSELTATGYAASCPSFRTSSTRWPGQRSSSASDGDECAAIRRRIDTLLRQNYGIDLSG